MGLSVWLYRVLKAARQIFDETDVDGSGSLDEYELLRLVQHLFTKMGMPVRTDQLPRLKMEVRNSMLRYDTDGYGTLEFDELVQMLVTPHSHSLTATSVLSAVRRSLERAPP